MTWIRPDPGGRPPGLIRSGVDPLGSAFAAFIALSVLALPLMTARPNRIAEGTSLMAWSALPSGQALALGGVLGLAAPLLALRVAPPLRLAAGAAALLLLGLAAGWAADHLTAPGDRYCRRLAGCGLVARLRLRGPRARRRVGAPAAGAGRAGSRLLAAGALLTGLALRIRVLGSTSRCCGNMPAAPTRSAGRCGPMRVSPSSSVAAATAVGIPAAILARPVPALRAALLAVLNVVQTIPSMALFGMLIAPLAWIGRTVPGAAASRDRAASVPRRPSWRCSPTRSCRWRPPPSRGSTRCPRPVRDAARGVGMTARQRLLQVEMPLALPAILTGIRIVLVQNIGLAVIAALVGGGGLGVFVFQGISQTAGDLVLLGALPTVALACAAAVLLDAVIDSRGRARRQSCHDRTRSRSAESSARVRSWPTSGLADRGRRRS